MPTLAHLVSLQQAAGVEAHCVEFIAAAAARHPRWAHAWINPERSVHPYFRDSLDATLAATIHAKYWCGLKLPAVPPALRAAHCRRALRKTGAGPVVIWNRTARLEFLLRGVSAEHCVHWEHGGAWHPGRERERSRYLNRVPLAITNSHASARVLQLQWQFPGTIETCVNALRPSLVPPDPAPRELRDDGRLRLGVAARLMHVKGIPVVLHAAAALRAQGRDVTVEIAGAGPERQALDTLAVRLGLGDACRFAGSLAAMREFYARIDCLVHVPLTEAFGLVAIEAAAHGVPVVAAAVDGLPEAVAEGISGRLVEPCLPLADYAGLGGGTDGVPPSVYDGRQDRLTAARIVDPAALAAAIAELADDPGGYTALSRSAAAHVRAEHDFDRHVDRVLAVLGRFAAGA